MPVVGLAYAAILIGSNIFNNIAASRNNDKIQRLNREAQDAVSSKNTELMWKLLRETQEATLKMEAEKQRQRLGDITSQIDELIRLKADVMAQQNWNLRVPPIVMTNQTVGNILSGNKSESIALHCIIASSDCHDFNKYVLPHIENALEAHFNKFWSTNTQHPVLFYGGSWVGRQPTKTDIESMRKNLCQIPTLVICPHFDTNYALTLTLDMWGLTGKKETNQIKTFDIIPDGTGDEQRFQRVYTKNIFRGPNNQIDETVVKECVEDLIPYLECLIGYIVDDYFWASYGIAPVLPNLVINGKINMDGMPYLIAESKAHYQNAIEEASSLVIEGKSSYNPIKQIPEFADYILSTKDLYNDQEYEIIESKVIDISGIFAPDKNIRSLQSVKEYWESVGIEVSSYKTVPLKDYRPINSNPQIVPEIDLEAEIGEFKKFICSNSDRINKDDVSLLIAEHNFESFTIIMCDSNSHDAIISPIEYIKLIKSDRVKHKKNIQSIFKFKQDFSIICKYSSIGKLVDKVNSTDYIY